MRAPDRRLKAVRAGSAAAIEENQHSCGLMPLPAICDGLEPLAHGMEMIQSLPEMEIGEVV